MKSSLEGSQSVRSPYNMTVRRHLNFYSRAIEKNCYSNDLENIDIYLAGICSLVRNSFYISAEITLYAVSNKVG